MVGEQLRGQSCLAFVGLNQHVPAGSKPICGLGSDPPLHVQSVRAAVERHGGFMQSCFRRHHCDVVGGNVGGVAEEDVDPAPQRIGERIEKVALIHPAAQRSNVAARAFHSCRFDIGGVQFNTACRCAQCGAQRAATAAKIEHDCVRSGHRGSKMDEEFGPPAGYKDAGADGNLQSIELHPAEDVLKWISSCPRVNHRREFVGGSFGTKQKFRFLFGEYAAGSLKPADNRSLRLIGFNEWCNRLPKKLVPGR